MLGLLSCSENSNIESSKSGITKMRLGDRLYIGYLGEYKIFKIYLIGYYYLYNFYTYKDVVIIGDGAPWIKNFKYEFFPNAILILDYFHLAERTWEFCKYIYNNDESKYKCAAIKMCKLLKEGKWQDVLDIINIYKDKKFPNEVINLYSYIYNNREYINYPLYISCGYFIGSGAIESSQKNVLQSRLKQSGMSWNKENAQFVITLRTKLLNKLWIEVEEACRNYFKY